jgi:alanine racemase
MKGLLKDLCLMRDTRLEVDLDAIAHNVRVVKTMLRNGPAPTAARQAATTDHVPAAAGAQVPKLAAVLKADAYGLGALPVAGALLDEGVDLLAVACLPEALEIRQRYPEAPLLVMGHTPDRLLALAVRKRIACTIFDARQARLLSAAAVASGCSAMVHIKIDTGMNRLGHKPGPDSASFFRQLAELPGLDIQGVFSHLALCDQASDQGQYELLMQTIHHMGEAGLKPGLRHLCDSIGLMRYPEYRLDMVRAGAVLYGVTPMNTPLSETADIHTPFAFRTRISRLCSLKAGEGVGYDFTWKAPAGGALLATLPVGYADGFRRCLANKGFVMVRGRRAPVVGLVCMDQCTVDMSDVPEAREGEEVLLLGQSGEESIPVLEMASWAGTNRNEVISAIGRRVPRVYHRSGHPLAVRDYVLGTEDSPEQGSPTESAAMEGFHG